MDNKSDEQFLIMQGSIEANNQEMKSNKQYSDDKMIKVTSDFKSIITSAITSMMD